MEEQGKISRAMEKMGAGDALLPQAERSSQESPHLPSPPRPAPQAAPADSIRRVKDHCGPVGPSVVMKRKDEKSTDVAAEVRALRARIMAIKDPAPPRVIMVSSSQREEGKTTIAFNLAVALSELDAGRVVVLDGDIPAPGLHIPEVANLQVETGLTQILESGLDLNGNVYETAVEGLDVIPGSGVESDHDLERKLNQQCKRLLDKLRTFYSYVIVDTPPARAGSYAYTFGKHCDGVVLVARLERTPREIVKRTADDLKESGARVIGCVLTHRRDRVPEFLYRLVGIPSRYYRSSRRKGAPLPVAKTGGSGSQGAK
jgi:capsular exopolysaccharide synthesis family protein